MESPNNSQRKIVYNLPQMALAISRVPMLSWEGGRGVGKSTGLSNRIVNYDQELPRAKIAMPGETYKQLLTRTLPSTIEGLEFHGYKKDIRYLVGKRPPANWRWTEAYQPPLDYSDCIIFPNGLTCQLVSLETDTGGRGNNFDGVIADETGSMNVTRLSNNVLAANRGNIDRFKGHWLHHAILLVGSTSLTQSGKWFSDLADLALLDPDKCLHIISTSYMNAENLGEDFFKTCLRLMTPMQFGAEILCQRPGQIEHGFYPNFSENKHTYDASNINYLFGLEGNIEELKKETCKTDSDLRDDLPIDIACDWGVTINTMCCGQDALLGNEYRYLNALHVLSPQTIPDLANKFCDYYESKTLHAVHFHHDHTAVGRSPNGGLTFAAQMIKSLRDRGWTVRTTYHGQAPGHNDKFVFWEIAHREAKDNKLPIFRYNKNNCKFLIVSMQQAGALDGKKGIEKDKRPERRKGQKQEEATHHSDGHDTLGYFKFKHRLESTGWVF